MEAGNAVLRLHIPTIYIASDARKGATEYLRVLGQFARDLVTWLRVFADSLARYWKTEENKRARVASITAIAEQSLRNTPGKAKL